MQARGRLFIRHQGGRAEMLCIKKEEGGDTLGGVIWKENENSGMPPRKKTFGT